MAKRKESENQVNNIQSVERALNILELLSKTQLPMGAIEISQELGINRTTVYGLMNTLINMDYVVRSEVGSKYTISGRMYSLSYSYPNRLPVVQYAQRYMQELSDTYNTTIHLGTLTIRHDVLLINARFPKNIQNIRSGSSFPLHASGMGKVLLAFSSPEKREDMIARCDFQAFTRKTIVDRDVMEKEMQEIREQGYGCDEEEYMEGTACIAFPIFNSRDDITAAMSVSGTCDQINGQREQIIRDGLRCSKQCSSEMGWRMYNSR